MCKLIKYAGMIMFLWLLLATIRISGQLHDKYIGCFVDNINVRQLEPVLKDQDNLTIEICIQKCYSGTNETQLEMTYAALNNGRNCMCRNNFGQQLRDRNCNVKCSGNAQQVCGGNAASEFYSLYSVCGVGYFGRNCDQICHCKRQLPCDRKTGICSDGCDEPWTGTNCNISNVQKRYIGCYGDGPVEQKKEAMDVKNPGGKSGVNEQDSNSNEFCIEICSNNNYTYAGMQYRFDCNCGEAYNRYGNKTHRGTNVNCNEPCSGIGKGNQTCGGSFANSVYYVCPKGFYGRDCINRCHCSDGGWCRYNGSCLTSPLSACKPGWTGSACNVRDCTIKNGDCESGEKCETVDLGYENFTTCRCENGSYRDNNTCIPIHLNYVGCYKGNTTQYALVELPTNDTLTTELCILRCRQRNRKYSIIQGGVACFCGDDYGQISPDDECQVPCVGNRLQYCGGKNTVDGTPLYVVYTAKSPLRGYFGCYKDERNPSLPVKFSWSGAGNNTIESCIRQCDFHNFTYAGLQYQYDCLCGDSYDKYGRLPESSCNMPCTGDQSQICGGNYANSVYAVNDILWCSTYRSRDCKWNEACDVIDLKYTNVSRCRCIKGFHRMSKWDLCTDVDECKSNTSSCNPTSEKCFNDIGSYICECKAGFVNISGQCEDIDECSNDLMMCDHERELCRNTIGSYQCHCKPGYEYSTFGNCTDVDECQLNRSLLSCNAFSEYCINSIGSYSCYICPCNEGFANMHVHVSGNRDEISNNSTIGIILGSLLAISLLINVLFVIFRIKSANSNLETCKVGTQSDIQPSCVKISDQQEMTYDEIPTLVDHGSVYERIILEKRQIVQDPTSEYAALKHDDYLNVETST